MDRPSPRGAYSTREVAALLGLSQAQIRACARAGFVAPETGPRGELRFSFQDLVLLRTAKALLAARIPRRRIRLALENLHAQLPQGQPLTAVRISAQGQHVVARDGSEVWHPESGQTLLDFGDLARGAEALAPRRLPRPEEAAPRRVPMAVPGVPPPGSQATADAAADWYEHGVALEGDDPGGAMAAYRRAIELDPALADAHLNLGRLLHEAGEPGRAEVHYRRALDVDPGDALAAYNLGVALQDQRHLRAAATAYERALANDPQLADAHFNLSGVYEQLGDKAGAFRHLRTYRALTGQGGGAGGPRNPRHPRTGR